MTRGRIVHRNGRWCVYRLVHADYGPACGEWVEVRRFDSITDAVQCASDHRLDVAP